MAKYLIAFLDHGVTAAAGIALQIFLIRTVSAEDYGSFTFWQGIGLLVLGIQGALITTQLSVRGGSERTALEPTFGALNAMMMAAVFAITALLAAPVTHLADLSSIGSMGIAAYFAGMLIYQYARGIAFSRQLPSVALKIDLVYVAGAILAIGLAVLANHDTRLGLLFPALAAASILAGVIGLAIQPGSYRISFRPESLSRYRDIFADGKWAAVGVITYELQVRSYIFLVTSLAGPATVAELNAAQLPFRPVGLLATSWSMLARPQFASALVEDGVAAFSRRVQVGAASLAVASLAYLVLVAIAWPLITELVFAGRYPDTGLIAFGWGIGSAVVAVRVAFNVALQAGRKFRLLTAANVAGALGSILGSVIAALTLGHRFVPFGLLLGDLAMAALVWRGYRQMIGLQARHGG